MFTEETMSRKRCRETKDDNPYPLTPVHQFWTDVDEGIDTDLTLPDMVIVSIKSFLAQGHPVVLWTYHRSITNPVEGMVWEDAGKIITRAQFNRWKPHNNKYDRTDKLKKIPHIAQFSDLFRIELLHKHGGWWSDSDLVCMRPFPTPRKKDRGVIFASQPCKLTGTRIWKAGMVAGGRFSNAAIYCEKDHPLMPKIADKLRSRFKEKWFSSFVVLMIDTYDIIEEEGYEESCRKPHDFVPIPWWPCKYLVDKEPPKKSQTSYGYRVPTIDQIMRNSYSIHLYKGPIHRMQKAPESCYMHTIARHIEDMTDHPFDSIDKSVTY